MKTYSEYRAEARAALKGKWNMAALFVFVYAIISVVVSTILGFVPFVGSIAAAFVMLPVAFGVVVGFLRVFRGEELDFNWMFQNFNSRVWVTLILQNVYIFLWALLLVIPGIIKSYSYAMTSYILRDDAEICNNAAIEKSMAMMSGNKWRLFVLDLTFLGWYLLSILTLGIGAFWVYPYHQTARAAFYEDLKAAAPATVEA